MKKLGKKQIGLLAVVVQVLLVIICAVTGHHELAHINIPYQELVGTTIPDERGGWYIDETFPCLEDGLFDSTEKMTLDKGTYNITVNYETDRENNYSTVASKSAEYFKLFADETPLPSRKHAVTYTIYLLKDVTDLEIKNYYCKEGYLIIKDITVDETSAYLRMKLFLLILLFSLFDLIWYAFWKGLFANVSREQCITVMMVVAVATYASMQIWDGFMTDTQDLAFHLLRIEGLKEGLRSGQFPVKMQPNWLDGYGYPVSVYYGDLFLYIPAFLRLVGFPVQFSYGVFVFLINLATAGIACWCCFKISGDRAVSLVCAMLYVLIPYRLTDLYERNAFGETLAIAFLPLIVYGMYHVFTADSSEKAFGKSWLPLVVGFTGIIESHILTCIMCAFFVILDCVIHWKKVLEKERFVVLAKTVIYTSLLNAGFVFPCITSMKGLDITAPYRIGNRIQWGGTLYTEMFRTYNNGTGPVLSVGSVAAAVLFLYLLLYVTHRTDSGIGTFLRQGAHLWVFAILSLYMASMYFPWNRISDLLGKYSMMVNNIQFQFRFLGIASVFVMVVCCFALKGMRGAGGGKYFQSALLGIGVIVFVSGSYMIDTRISEYPHFTVYDIDKYGRTDHNVGEYVLYGTDFRSLEPDRVSLGEGAVLDAYAKKYTDITLTCKNTSDSDSYIEVPLLYYSQYRAKDEMGNVMSLVYGDNNVMRLLLPAGYQGTVHIHYRQPVFWRICEIISVLTFLAMAAEMFHRRFGRPRRIRKG